MLKLVLRDGVKKCTLLLPGVKKKPHSNSNFNISRPLLIRGSLAQVQGGSAENEAVTRVSASFFRDPEIFIRRVRH